MERVVGAIWESAREFYLSLDECEIELLVLCLLHHFSSFEDMNNSLGKGRFMAALASHVAEEKAGKFMFLFESEQLKLVELSRKGLLSMGPFYKLGALRFKDVRMES